ncbi:Type I restriction-modification system, DNA-methyltransferase subunit M [Bacteroides ovatus]|jgi:type I restriction-modification system, M subunit|uniref:type I restriction-modification system subunit M n=1 Tax=Bacteroidales TaxID=171549 RepID=UPI000240E3F4|nr:MULTISPECIES: type I restriction-modification system subunit M [Bacteroidales]EHL86909.1 type I restriction-modification system, M subunit [Tannerella sp. 6_1_58FAA_CT1]CAG9915940.1 Type I restriction-modification system, DNA-methyltransferase subunit M [Bacteroides ovatus]
MNKQQLANKIWASANKMRSKIDANEYKDYILGLIFYKFLCDNEEQYLRKDGWTDEDMPYLVEDYEDANAKETIEYCKNNIGYFIEYKYLFSTWLKPDSMFNVADLSAALNNFDRLVSPNYRSVYEKIFLTLQAGLSKLGENPASQTRALKDLIKLIKDIPTDGSQDYDVLGYVYEYLIGNFAANAGKKAGEFYTPHEVAILMSEIVAEHHKVKETIEIYDPTSGSGSLLITIGKSVGRHIEDKNKVKYYAQELKENTYNLTRMNLVMRGIKPDNINTRCADSLDEDWPVQAGDMNKPLYVDAVVSNPPYSQQWNPADAEMDSRFKDYGVAPKSKADYAFLLHELHHIKPDGILTIVLPHGVLFRGDPEKDADGEGKIRKNLIEKNNIDAIIGLPANIFFGTGIPTLIMVLKQHRDNDDVLIINASKGFVKDGKQNKLRACDIKRITDTVRDRKSIPGFSRAVSRDEIRQNGYNLNIPRYVDSSEAAVQYDIYATMFGGIPENEIDLLDNYWQALPSLRSELFKSNEDGSPYASVKVGNIADAINVNADVKALQQSFADAFEGFEDMLHEHLITNVMSVKEMKEQDIIAEEIFHRLESIALVDKYTAYQVLADNWQIIINDIETIQSDGIDAVRTVEPAYKIKKDGDDEIEVPDGLKGRIMPFELVQSVNFQSELDAIAQLQAEVDECVSNLEDAPNNFTEEEAAVYLEDGDNLKLNKKKITKDAKAKGDFIEPDTKVKLKEIVALWDKQSKTNKAIKVAKTELEEKTIDAIENLTNEEVDFFLHKKWIDPICQGISNTLTVVLSTFEKAIVALEAKYAESYNEIESKITDNQSQLTEMIAQLTGDEFAIKGLNNLIKE